MKLRSYTKLISQLVFLKTNFSIIFFVNKRVGRQNVYERKVRRQKPFFKRMMDYDAKNLAKTMIWRIDNPFAVDENQ